jgi:hypothetical protein
MASGSQDLGTGYNNATTESLGTYLLVLPAVRRRASTKSPQHRNTRLATKREFEDGRVFRYAKFAGATAAGVLVSQDLICHCGG